MSTLAYRLVGFPKLILVGAIVLIALCGAFGAPVNSLLAAGGYQDPAAESAQAQRILAESFGRGGQLVVLELSNPMKADIARDPAARARAAEIIEALDQYAFVQQPVVSLWTTPHAAAALQSRDRHAGLIVVPIEGGDKDAANNAKAIADRFSGRSGDLLISAGGQPLGYAQADELAKRDLLRAESIAIPISFLLLVWVFGGLVAAALPIVVGLFAIVGTTAILRVLTSFTEVSVFALNLTTALGLALAIDYTLLIITRYREELDSGSPRQQAVVKTITTAGRTVLYSAVTVALSLAAMAIFPMYFLRSFAYAGVAVVALSAFAALVVAPAMLAVLGDKVDALDVRGPIRRTLGRPARTVTRPEDSFWYRSTRFVLQHSVSVAIACTVLLLALGVPFLGVHFSYPDDRVLPAATSTRQVGDHIRNQYDHNVLATVTVVVTDVSRADLADYAQSLSRVPGSSLVTGPDASYAGGQPVGPGNPQAANGTTAYLTITVAVDPFSHSGDALLDALHAVPTPTGAHASFDGIAQQNRDNVRSILKHLPTVLLLIALTTFALLFLLTGSVLLPAKALVLNVLSLSATFGAMVWIFQDGHLGGLGTTATGALVANVPVLMFCIAFGLSMDYEVFLLSRIREEWLGSARTKAGNEDAIAYGIARTGRVITTAAALMMIVFAAMGTSQVAIMRLLGTGLTLAVLIDATVIRILLVPAFMQIAGRANWWAPAPLRRLHDRIGWSEQGGPPVMRSSGRTKTDDAPSN